MKKTKLLVSTMLASTLVSAPAKTLLLDAQNTGGDAPASTTADFAAYDSNVALTAPISIVASWADLSAATLTDEDGLTYAVTAEGQAPRGFAASGALTWTDMVPIVESYFYKDNNRDEPQTTITITGMEQIPAGELITLTVFGVGDNSTATGPGQGSTFSASYGDASLAGQITGYGSNPRNVETDSVRSAQFQFVSDATTTSLSFLWDRNADRYSALNGFSITSSTPTFGEVTDTTLTTAGDTTFLRGAPDVQLTAEATFSTAGVIDVTGLGSSIVSFASDNTDAVTVTGGGLVSFVGPGTATITATTSGDNSTTASGTLAFDVELPTSLTVTAPDPILLQNGFTTNLSAVASSLSLTDVDVESYPDFAYSSSDLDIAEVDMTSGVVTPALDGNGVVTITATLGGAEEPQAVGTQDITIEPALSVAITLPATTIYIGGATITASVTATSASLTDIPINGLAALELFSGDPDIAFIDSDTGVISAEINEGTTTIEADFFPADLASVEITVVQPPAKPTSLIHRYSFTGTADAAAPEATMIPDLVGTAHGEILGTGAVFDATGTALVLPGGPDVDGGGYVNLPNGILSTIPDVDTIGITIETWVTKSADINWMRICDFGNSGNGEGNVGDPTSFIDLIAQRSGGSKAIVNEFRAEGNNDSQFFQGTDSLALDVQSQVVLTIDPQTGVRNLYKDGLPIGSQSLEFGRNLISEIIDLNCWLGRSISDDNRLNGSLDEFRIYTGIMTEAQVAASQVAGPDTLPTVVDPVPYSTWTALYAGDQGPDEDFDKDGMSNGVEYFMGETNDPIFTPNPQIVDGKITWPFDPAFDGTYTVQTSPDLLIWTNRASVQGNTTVEYTTTGGPDERFARLQVTPTAAP